MLKITKYTEITMTPEQLEARRRYITGTDIAALCGQSPYKTPLDVYADKIGAPTVAVDNGAAVWGNILEPVIAQHWAAEHRVFIEPGCFLVHPTNPLCAGTPDFLAIDREHGLEIKTAGYRMRAQWGDDADNVPMHYLMQCHWYMILTGLPRWNLAALIGGQDYREFIIEADAELHGMLLQTAADFMTFVAARTPPPVDADSGRALARLYPHATRPVLITASDEVATWARNLAELRRKAAEIDAELTAAENNIKLAIGDAQGVEGLEYKITWKAPKAATKIDWEALAHDLGANPEDLQRFTRPTTPSRRFLPSGQMFLKK